MNELTEPLVDGRQPTLSVRAFLVPLRRRDFRWLVTGQMLSTFGDMLFMVALPFIVLRTGDAGDLTIMLTLLGIARIVGAPLGGVLSDRWNPRSVMLVADAARAAVLFGLIAMADSGGPWLTYFSIGVALLGGLDGMFLPAYWATIPTLLPEEELPVGNAVGESLLVFTVMVGTLVGGLTAAWMAPTAVLAVNALTFLMSAGTLLRMSDRRAPEPVMVGTGDTSGFWSFARGSRLFLAVLLMAGMLHLTSAGIMSVALPVYVDEQFTGGQGVFGFLLSAHGAGLLLGTLAAGLAWRISRRGQLAVGLLVVDGVALTVFPHLPGLVALMVSMLVLGLVAGVLSILAVTILQQTSPPEIRGRVMAALTVVTLGAYPISAVAIGMVVIGPGAESAFLFGGLGVLAAAVVGGSQRAVRDT